MAGFKEVLLDVLSLTDEVKQMNRDIERVEATLIDVDKRVVRLETVIEIAAAQSGQKQIKKSNRCTSWHLILSTVSKLIEVDRLLSPAAVTRGVMHE
jgi:hypothetical protein